MLGDQAVSGPRWSQGRYTRSWTVQRLVFEHHFPGPKPFSREKQTVTCWEPQLGAASWGSKSCFEHKPSWTGGCTSLQQAVAKQPPCLLAFNNISPQLLSPSHSNTCLSLPAKVPARRADLSSGMPSLPFRC